jgi:hypothetical protein
MKYNEDLEKLLTGIFSIVGLLAIIIKLFITGWTNENVLDALINLAGLVVTIIVFLVAFQAMRRLDYASFKREFEKNLQEWINQNEYLIDKEKIQAGKENKRFYYILSKAHHNNVVLQEKTAHEFPIKDGFYWHKGVFLYTDYKDKEEIIIGLNRSFFISKRGGDLPKPFNSLMDIAENFKLRIKEHFQGKFDYDKKVDNGLPIEITDEGTRLHISINKIANTKDNAKTAIDMLEYIKTLIIALA